MHKGGREAFGMRERRRGVKIWCAGARGSGKLLGFSDEMLRQLTW